jgi:hypothetical protein
MFSVYGTKIAGTMGLANPSFLASPDDAYTIAATSRLFLPPTKPPADDLRSPRTFTRVSEGVAIGKVALRKGPIDHRQGRRYDSSVPFQILPSTSGMRSTAKYSD